MRVTELRIGNFINVTKSEYKSEKKQDYWVVSSATIMLMEQGGVEVYGIPLTEEWLERFGFKEGVSGNKRFKLELSSIYIAVEFTQSLVSCVELGVANDVIIDIGYVKYVHQLQNLYFALTNEEL